MTGVPELTEHVRKRPDARALRNDVLLAVGLGVASTIMAALTLAFSGGGPSSGYGVPISWPIMLGSFAFNLPLAFRRRWPVPVAVVICVLYGVLSTNGWIEITSAQVTLFLAFYSIGAWEMRRRVAHVSRLVIVIGMALWLGVNFVVVMTTTSPDEMPVNAMFAFFGFQTAINVAYFGGAWMFGNRAWNQAVEHQQLERANAEIQQQQAQLTEQAVSLERVRIARELHDVVAHHVSAMGIQAGAARRVIDRDQDAATTALKSVEQSARDAISELRTMVVALRSDDDTDEPMPGLDDIPSLVSTARDAGHIVDLQVVGTARPVTPVIALTAYRVLQEALTNARKHAGPLAAVDARIRYLDGSFEIEVTDDGHGSPTGQAGTGMGLVGMAERVAAVGGTLDARARSGGGWLVRATLPTQPTPPVTVHQPELATERPTA